MLLKEDVAMRTLDFSPLARSSVGFDRLYDLINKQFQLVQGQDDYPPYDIVRTGEDSYSISLSVAGFAPEDLTVTAQQNLLIVSGERTKPAAEAEYFHRGIAARPFELRFGLEDHVEVKEATYQNGLLQIHLVRNLPEAMRPRKIAIAPSRSSNGQRDRIESRKAA
jgi:molecular chaperone IbpA